VQAAVGVGQAFDRRDGRTGGRRHRQHATALRCAVHKHGAGSTLGEAAAELRAYEAESLAQQHQQRLVLPGVWHGMGLAVDL